ncbi:uncharacterized protein involved in exopolysaccharide biosynthesis [Burkholderia sp. OAS925]
MAINFENRYTDVSAADELHLSDYLRTIVRGWRTIATVTLIALALGCAYAFVAPPTYRADVLFHVEDKTANANANGKDSLPPLTGMFDTKPSTAAEIELLKSRLVTEETVKKLHLDITATPRYMPVIGGLIAGLVNGQWGFKLPQFINLSGYAWGNESISVSRFDTSKEMYDTTFTLVAGNDRSYVLRDRNGIAILSGHVGETVQTDTADGPIALRVDALTGAAGSQFELSRASTLSTVDRLQKALVVQETTLQSGVIRASLEGGDSALTAAIVNSMAREFVRQDVASRSTEAEHMLAFLDQQLPGLRKELDEAEQRYNKFRNTHGTVDLGEESRLLLQQIVDNKTKLLDLQTQRAEMSQRFTANHPAVASLDAQIAALQGAQVNMNRSVSVMPDTEQTALRLLRDVHVDTELYTNLLNSAQQLRVAKAGQVGNVRVGRFRRSTR